MEEDDEEEGDDDNMIICGFAEYGAFDDTAMEEAEEEVAVEEEVVAEDKSNDDIGQTIRDAQRECESDKEKIKFEHMLEDHTWNVCSETKTMQSYCDGTLLMGPSEEQSIENSWSLQMTQET